MDAIKTGLTVGAGTGGVAALLLSFRKQWLSEHIARDTSFDAAERRVTELYGRAVEQLGHETAAVRLGGLYSLERLAQDHRQHRQTVVDVICAYLRMPFTPTSVGGMDEKWSARQELQVRLAAQSLLTRHLKRPRSGTADRDNQLAGAFWPGMRIDLSGAALIGFDMTTCQVSQADFRGAEFAGYAGFSEAEFSGIAGFEGAKFAGDAWFEAAEFAGYAGFRKVTFTGDAWFNAARFAEKARFNETEFAGDAWFQNVTVIGDAGFGRAAFARNAGFERAAFAGEADFRGAEFAGYAGFSEVKFAGPAGFSEAKFAGNTGFEEAKFAENAWFQKAEFTREAEFEETKFAGYTVFREAAFTGPAGFNKAEFAGPALFEKTEFGIPPKFAGASAAKDSEARHVWPTGWTCPDGNLVKQLPADTSSGSAKTRREPSSS